MRPFVKLAELDHRQDDFMDRDLSFSKYQMCRTKVYVEKIVTNPIVIAEKDQSIASPFRVKRMNEWWLALHLDSRYLLVDDVVIFVPTLADTGFLRKPSESRQRSSQCGRIAPNQKT